MNNSIKFSRFRQENLIARGIFRQEKSPAFSSSNPKTKNKTILEIKMQFSPEILFKDAVPSWRLFP